MQKVDLVKYSALKNYADIEAKGFYGALHTKDDVWCFCNEVVDPDTEESVVLLFHDYPEFDNVTVVDPDTNEEHTVPERVGTLEEGAKYWNMIITNGGSLSVHNICTYDRPVYRKFWPEYTLPLKSCEDTMVNSKVQWHDRPCPKGAKSAHGLQGYGLKFGYPKTVIEEWTTMNALKLIRCVRDVRIQRLTSEYLCNEAATLKSRFGIDTSAVIEAVEKPYAAFTFDQEEQGAKVDVEHIKRCITFLDKNLAELEAEIEPRLPPTIKKKTGRVGRAEMTKALLGKDVAEEVDSQGEIIKRYYKPHVNFYNKADRSFYSGFHISYGESPEFEKLKEMREWVKAEHPDTEFKEWSYEKTTVEGKKLDNGTVTHFEVEPTDLGTIAGPHTRFNLVTSKLTQHEVVKQLLIIQGISWAMEWNFKTDENDRRIKAEEETTIYYPATAPKGQRMEYVVKKGGFIVTSPKFGDKEYDQLGDDADLGHMIKKYNTYQHRRRFLENKKDPENKGVMSYLRPDGKVPCGLGAFSTSTGRSNQRVVVNLPSEKALFGKEMREMIIAEEGHVLIGADMKSAQLSIAAFIADNAHYYEAVATGKESYKDEKKNDIYTFTSAHCVNLQAFGLASEEEVELARQTQDVELCKRLSMLRGKKAKGLAFACIFGASGQKMALMASIPEKEGKVMKDRYLKTMGLDKVVEFGKRCQQQFPWGGGFFMPVFGHWLWCKSAHVATNYLCQGIEAMAQKVATLWLVQELDKRGYEGAKVIAGFHDENLLTSPKEIADEVGDLASEAYSYAGKVLANWYKKNYNLHPVGGTDIVVDLAGGYAKGKNYYEVH